MLEGLFSQLSNQTANVPPAVLQKSFREPLKAAVYKGSSPVPPIHRHNKQYPNLQTLSDQDRQKILDYLTAIGETDQKVIQEMLQICAVDADKRIWMLQWAEQHLPKPPVELLDDRHYCRECLHLKNKRCQKQDFRPVDDVPRRCGDYQGLTF
ncbi:hypothetical protein [Methylomicrobium agile]|uniref:hypothetical protein n=1 Tax=Methylomicrobium agile TaxID=39774 RepID=UPI001FE0630B|nr:hypothetical protein [Methylomicrobium agile]